MKNFKLTLEYDGTNFNGWQNQLKKGRTVQAEVEKVLSQIYKTKVNLVGSGRTDSGVHAAGQVANFQVETRMNAYEVFRAMNSLLPEDIAVLKAEEVPLKFHAQFSAKWKTYRYTLLARKHRSALSRNFALYYPYPLNVSLMRKEAKVLIGTKDFKSFQASDSLREDQPTVRTIKRLTIKKSKDYIYIEIEGNGFLYKMVRNIVGTLLEVGSGLKPAGTIRKVLKEKRRQAAGQTAAAHGLTLLKVDY